VSHQCPVLCEFFFNLNDLSIVVSGVLKYSPIIVVGSICTYKFSSVFLMKLGAPTFGAYKLTIVISSWWIVPFINMNFVSSIFCLKFILSDTSIATSVCSQDLSA
jgi:hypothetical protein